MAAHSPLPVLIVFDEYVTVTGWMFSGSPQIGQWDG
jgi:hypothetical protein